MTSELDGLEILAPDLRERLVHEPPTRIRALAVLICEFAIERSQLDSDVIRESLHSIRQGSVIRSDLRAEVEHLAESLDDRYFELAKEEEAGRATEGSHDPWFRKARAASAVLFACGEEAFPSLAECIYEANFAVEEADGLQGPGLVVPLRALVEQFLG